MCEPGEFDLLLRDAILQGRDLVVKDGFDDFMLANQGAAEIFFSLLHDVCPAISMSKA